jgi:hypothetical protein
LLRDKGFTGFPALAFMDAEGNVIAKQGERSVDGFEKTLVKVKTLQDVRAAAARGGDEKALKKVLMAELDLGLLSAEEIVARKDAIKNFTNDEAATIERCLVDAEIRALQGKSRELGPDKVAHEVAAIAKAGRRPNADMAMPFWAYTLTHAANSGDGKLATEAFGQLEKLAGDDKRYTRSLDAWRKLLEKAKAGT